MRRKKNKNDFEFGYYNCIGCDEYKWVIVKKEGRYGGCCLECLKKTDLYDAKIGFLFYETFNKSVTYGILQKSLDDMAFQILHKVNLAEEVDIK